VKLFVQAIQLIQDVNAREALMQLAEHVTQNDLLIGKSLNTTIERCTQVADLVNTLADRLIAVENELRELKAINGKVS
jgi:hypothetical protein